MDILTVNQLIALHIAIPVSTDDIPAAVALLTEKEAFLSEQAAQTAANNRQRRQGLPSSARQLKRKIQSYNFSYAYASSKISAWALAGSFEQELA
ncbi:hypothetical protein BASA81_018443 [Batrachochytrium salamandrivorans]|nr:hypothetical protein BASA81_018443 [Batrachochytrium salamandrivorans]